MPNKARTHSEARPVICSVCWKKTGTSGSNVSKEIELLIKQHVFEGYSLSNESYPSSICGSCRVCLKEIDKVKKIKEKYFIFQISES